MTGWTMCCGARENKFEDEKRPPIIDPQTGEEKPAAPEPVQRPREPPRDVRPPSLMQKVGRAACCTPSSKVAAPTSLAPAPEMPRSSFVANGAEPALPRAAQVVSSVAALHGPEVPGDAPRLGGSWSLSKYTGDMDAFLADMGQGESDRGKARKANYGIKMQQVKLTQDANGEVKLSYTGCAPYEQIFRVGGGIQSAETVSGTTQVKPSWEGRALRMDLFNTDGQEQCSRWLYFDASSMVVESKHVCGSHVKQIYERIDNGHQ